MAGSARDNRALDRDDQQGDRPVREIAQRHRFARHDCSRMTGVELRCAGVLLQPLVGAKQRDRARWRPEFEDAWACPSASVAFGGSTILPGR
jgi:hypothetical protein